MSNSANKIIAWYVASEPNEKIIAALNAKKDQYQIEHVYSYQNLMSRFANSNQAHAEVVFLAELHHRDSVCDPLQIATDLAVRGHTSIVPVFAEPDENRRLREWTPQDRQAAGVRNLEIIGWGDKEHPIDDPLGTFTAETAAVILTRMGEQIGPGSGGYIEREPL